MAKHIFWGIIVLLSALIISLSQVITDMYQLKYSKKEKSIELLIFNKVLGTVDVLYLTKKDKRHIHWNPRDQKGYEIPWKHIEE